MKAGSAVKIAKVSFYILMVVTVAVLGMFYFVGYDNTTMVAAGPATDPENLDLLMYWMYALIAVSVVCVLFSTGKQFITMLKSEPKAALKGVLYLVLLVALFGVAYSISSDEPVANNGKMETDALILKGTDVCIYVQYVLLLVSTLCTVVALTGVTKVVNKVKA